MQGRFRFAAATVPDMSTGCEGFKSVWTNSVPPQDLQAAQILTGGTMALWLALGYVPALRRHASRARIILLVVYLCGCAGLFLRALLR
jgi:hypothetical protein